MMFRKITVTIACLLLGGWSIAQTTIEQQALELARQGKLPEAITAFEKIVATTPANTDALNALGQLYLQTGKPQAAYEISTRGLLLQPANDNLAINKARAAIALKKPAEALTLMDAAISRSAGFFMPYVIKANALDAQQQTQQAIALYTRSIELAPDYAPAYYHRGIDLAALNRQSEAIGDLTKATALWPNYADAWFELAMLQEQAQELDKAHNSIRQAITQQPAQASYRALEAKIWLAARKDAEGLAAAEKALSLQPDHADALLLKTTALSNLKRFDEAINTASAGIQLHPDEAGFYSVRAFIYKIQGKTDLATHDDGRARQLSGQAAYAPLEGQNDECIAGNCRNGYGTVQFPSGNKYTGNFVNRQRQGQGVFFFANGDRFDGQFDKDLRQSGTYTFQNGFRFTGSFRNEEFYNGTFASPQGATVQLVNGEVKPLVPQATDQVSGAGTKLPCTNPTSCPRCHGKGISYEPIQQKLSWSTKDTYSVDRYGNKSLTYAGQSGGNTYSIPNYVACARCGGKGSICK